MFVKFLLYAFSHIFKGPRDKSLHMEFICNDFSVWEAAFSHALKHSAHIHNNILYLLAIVKLKVCKVCAEAVYTSFRQNINYFPFAGISQYALEFLSICTSLEFINRNHFRKRIAGISHVVKNSCNSRGGNVSPYADFLHGLNLGRLVNYKSPDSLSIPLVLRYKMIK